MALEEVPLTGMNEREADSAEQDQTVCMCQLILLYTLCIIYPWSGLGLGTVKPVLETTCIKIPPALRDHCSDTPTLLKST